MPRRRELEAALRHHRAGDLEEAAAGYRQLLAADPSHADALHLLGLVVHGQGRDEEGLALVTRAAALTPHARYFANQAMLLHRLGRHAAAEQAARRAIERQPLYPEALNTLGAVLLARGDPVAAEAVLRDAVATQPGYAEALVNLGLALAEQGEIEAATRALGDARKIKPAILGRAVPDTGGRRRVLFVSVAPHLPGSTYRCTRLAAAARAAGWAAEWIGVTELTEADVIGLDVLILWRVEWSAELGRLVALARAFGTRVGLDLDDLVIDPALARAAIIDGIRSTLVAEGDVRAHFVRMRQMQLATDFATCTTEELAEVLRPTGRPVRVVANRFDTDAWRVARRALRTRRSRPEDGVLRIGYAGGTRTHQEDMRVVGPALVQVLTAYPIARLVLFRDPEDGRGMVLLEELPEMTGLAAQIEWRNLVPLADLPREIVRFDINIVPLQVGNAFVEAKSELKYFEAALVEVPTIASPTGPYRRAISDGETGLLAGSEAAWVEALSRLLADPALRRRLGRAAYRDVVWRYGPQGAARAMAGLLDAAVGQADAALARPGAVPDCLLAHDDGGDSAVTVAVSLGEAAEPLAALDGVAAQDLADLDLVVAPDGAGEAVVAAALDWLRRNRARFHRAAVLRAAAGQAAAADWAATPWVLRCDARQALPADAARRLIGDAAAMAGSPPDSAETRLVARVIDAYHAMLATPLGSDDSFWFQGFAARKQDIHDALMARDGLWLARHLGDPGRTDLMFGFENLSRSLLLDPPDPVVAAAGVAGDIATLCAAMGLRRMRHATVAWPADATDTVEDRLAAIEAALGAPLRFPAPFPGEVGLATSRGLVSYRAVQALYQAWRVAGLVRGIAAPRVLEIGAGQGRTAYHAVQLGIADYTIIDIPMSAVASANFLLRALGQDAVRLHGEAAAPGKVVRILPPSGFLAARDRYDLVLNVDSLTEMPGATMQAYLAAIHARAGMFLSINHEANPLWVTEQHPEHGRRRSRMPYWLRPGYVEELYGPG